MYMKDDMKCKKEIEMGTNKIPQEYAQQAHMPPHPSHCYPAMCCPMMMNMQCPLMHAQMMQQMQQNMQYPCMPQDMQYPNMPPNTMQSMSPCMY